LQEALSKKQSINETGAIQPIYILLEISIQLGQTFIIQL